MSEVSANEFRVLRLLESGDESEFHLNAPEVKSLLAKKMIGWFENGDYEKVAILLPAGRKAIARPTPSRNEVLEEAAKVAEHLNGWGSDCGAGGHADHIAAQIRALKSRGDHG